MGGSEIAIDVLSDACDILTIGGLSRRLGFAAPKRKRQRGNKDKAYIAGIPISRSSGESLRGTTSSYAGEI